VAWERSIVYPCCDGIIQHTHGGPDLQAPRRFWWSFDRAAPGSATLRVFTEVCALLRVDRNAEFDEVNVRGDFRRNLVRNLAKCIGRVVRRDTERVVPLKSSAIAEGHLVVHGGIYRAQGHRPMLRVCFSPHSDVGLRLTLLYRIAWGLVRLASPLFAFGGSKLARGMTGRRGARDLLVLWGEHVRDPCRPVVWFHAPSAGEGLQAKAVIEELRAKRPDVQVVYTFFSPSAGEFAGGMDVDVATYLPWDLRGPLSEVLEAVTPDAVLFTKTEVWPTLVAEAYRRGIPTGIVAATVPVGAGRMRPLARRILGPAWNALSIACANSEADAAALRSLGVRSVVLEVTGDPGIDSAATRFDARDRGASWLAPFRVDPRPTLVAGSTWGPDEDVLLPALLTVRDAVGDLRVVIAPHEPRGEVVRALLQRLGADGWNATTLLEFEQGESVQRLDVDRGPNAIVVERVGVLAELYEAASVSFVGGGFHTRGLHSVLEPAAAGSPIVFGPQHQNARAAADLIADAGAEVAGDPQALAGVLTKWLSDRSAGQDAGAAAARYIDRHRGAAARSAALLDSLLQITQ